MAWQKLDNPKPSASSIPRDHVRVSSRAAMKGTRFIVIKLGGGAAQRGSFSRDSHRCHVMVGSGTEAGQLAVALDDALGKFTAKRRKDGRYEISVTSAAAAAGGFNLTFPPFEREARIVPMGAGPSVITFCATPEFLLKAAA